MAIIYSFESGRRDGVLGRCQRRARLGAWERWRPRGGGGFYPHLEGLLGKYFDMYGEEPPADDDDDGEDDDERREGSATADAASHSGVSRGACQTSAHQSAGGGAGTA